MPRFSQGFERKDEPTRSDMLLLGDAANHDATRKASVGDVVKTIISDGTPSLDGVYSSSKIEQIVANMPHPITPEADKQVVVVEAYEDLGALESPSTNVLYLVRTTNELYSFDGETFDLVNDGNDTVYINRLGDLDGYGYGMAGNYDVVWLKEAAGGVSSATAWNFEVSVKGTETTAVYTQTLTSNNGYFTRQGTWSEALGSVKWGAWQSRVYAYTSDVHDGKLTVKMNGVKAATFTANQEDYTYVNLDSAAYMPDFAWWQKRTANQGASVLVTLPSTRPTAMAKNARLDLPLLEIGRSVPNGGNDANAEEWDFGVMFKIPVNATHLYIENFGLQGRYNYNDIWDSYGGTISLTLHTGDGGTYDMLFVINDQSTIGAAMPDGLAGKTVVGGRAEFTWQSQTKDVKFPRTLRLYADARETLTSGKHRYFDYFSQQWTEKYEWERLSASRFGLLRYEKGRWVVLDTTQGTVRVKRHFLECRIANVGKDEYRIDRTTWRTFSRPTGCDPNQDAGLEPTFVRACTRGGRVNIGGKYTGKKRKRVMRWLAQGGRKSNERTRYFMRENDGLTMDKIMRTMPFGKAMRNSEQVYLDTLFAETKNTVGNRRPFVKTLCARWRKCMKKDVATNEGVFIGWKFYGFMEKPFEQF